MVNYLRFKGKKLILIDKMVGLVESETLGIKSFIWVGSVN